jgi:long-chain fatty acid transport protein
MSLFYKILPLLYLAFPGLLFAGGFQLNLQGQKQAGMGHTGTATIHDASTLFFNPGSASFLTSKYNFIAGGNLIIPSTYYSELIPGNYSTYMNFSKGTPFSAYGSARFLNDKITFGMAIYTPFGSTGTWEDDWKGRFLVQKIALQVINVQPTVSWRIPEKLGIGAGFIYSTGNFYLRKSLPFQDSNGIYGSAAIKGSGNGIGFNAGAHYKITEKFDLGISHRNSVGLSLKSGEATFTVPTYLQSSFPSGNITGLLNLPSTTSMGLSYKHSEKLLFAVDLNYVGWSSYDTLFIDLENNTEKLSDIKSPKLFVNSYILRIGSQYTVSNSFQYRIGFYFDKSPVDNKNLGPETPDVSKLGFTSGFSCKINKNFNLDFSFIWIEGLKRNFINLDTGFSGTFKSRAIVTGIGLSYHF